MGWEKPCRRLPYPGSRTDCLVSTWGKYDTGETEYWHIAGELDALCRRTLAPFEPKNAKPSTGLCAVIIARHKYPDARILVIGFDYTLHPETAKNYRHDARAEHHCLASLHIEDPTWQDC